MPSDKVIEIILKLRDEVTKVLQGVQINLHKFSNQVKEMGTDMRKIGREISYVGSSMAMAGAAITTPLIAAYKEAGKYNADIAAQLNQTKNVFENLAVSIGTSLLPIMRRLTDELSAVVNWWNKLDQTTRDRIIQNIFNLGKNLILVGASLTIVGKGISTFANLLLILGAICTPLGLAVTSLTIAFGGLAIAMWNNQTVAETVSVAFAELTKIITGGLINIKPTGVSDALDEIKQKTAEVYDFIKNVQDAIKKGGGLLPEQPQGDFLSGFKLALQQTKQALESWRDMGIQAGSDLAKGLQSNFKTLFIDAFGRQLKTAQDYFKAFGDMILNIFADVCSKIISKWIETEIITGWANLFGTVGGVGGQIVNTGSQSVAGHSFTTAWSPYHTGGIIRAHSGLNLASDEVPIIAQTGERILSRSQNREYEKGSHKGDIYITINPTGIVKAYDFADFYAHKEEFQAMMAESIDMNKLRKVINANR
jgi:hypothetical protein